MTEWEVENFIAHPIRFLIQQGRGDFRGWWLPWNFTRTLACNFAAALHLRDATKNTIAKLEREKANEAAKLERRVAGWAEEERRLLRVIESLRNENKERIAQCVDPRILPMMPREDTGRCPGAPSSQYVKSYGHIPVSPTILSPEPVVRWLSWQLALAFERLGIVEPLPPPAVKPKRTSARRDPESGGAGGNPP